MRAVSLHRKRNGAASQEVTHSAVAVYAMIIAHRGLKRN